MKKKLIPLIIGWVACGEPVKQPDQVEAVAKKVNKKSPQACAPDLPQERPSGKNSTAQPGNSEMAKSNANPVQTSQLDKILTDRCRVDAQKLLHGVTQEQLEQISNDDLVQAFYSSLFMNNIKLDPVNNFIFNWSSIMCLICTIGHLTAIFLPIVILGCEAIISSHIKVFESPELNKYFADRVKCMPESFHEKYSQEQIDRALKLYTKECASVKLKSKTRLSIVVLFIQSMILLKGLGQPTAAPAHSLSSALLPSSSLLIYYFSRYFYPEWKKACFVEWSYFAYAIGTIIGWFPAINFSKAVYLLCSLFIMQNIKERLETWWEDEKDIAQSIRILYAHQKPEKASAKQTSKQPKDPDVKISIENEL